MKLGSQIASVYALFDAAVDLEKSKSSPLEVARDQLQEAKDIAKEGFSLDFWSKERGDAESEKGLAIALGLVGLPFNIALCLIAAGKDVLDAGVYASCAGINALFE